MSFRIYSLHEFAAYFAEHPDGARILQATTISNAYYDPSNEPTRALADYVIVVRRLEPLKNRLHSDDFAQMMTTLDLATDELSRRALA